MGILTETSEDLNRSHELDATPDVSDMAKLQEQHHLLTSRNHHNDTISRGGPNGTRENYNSFQQSERDSQLMSRDFLKMYKTRLNEQREEMRASKLQDTDDTQTILSKVGLSQKSGKTSVKRIIRIKQKD